MDPRTPRQSSINASSLTSFAGKPAPTQAFLGAFLEFFDQSLLAQRFAFVATDFGVDQCHGRAGKKEACALATLVSGETTYGIITDPAIERTIGRANQIDEPGLAHGDIGVDRIFAKGGHVTIRT
ncbi:hypothetical protein AEQ67_23900 [Pseudomonas sp. RIT-PI-q]|nr:hypothetical protein AEQ67_23900 [Pseudomonas sp. RIT-PI-q]